jgi:Galactose oxidase, central domain
MVQLGGSRSRPVVWAAVALVALAAAGCAPAATSSSPAASANEPGTTTAAPRRSDAPTGNLTSAPTSEPTSRPTYGPPGKFVPTGSMTMGRDSATATLLLDGRVLIAGGSGYDAARSAELYDPTTGRFSQTGSMTRGHEVGTATLLLDGRVLIVGDWEYVSRTNRLESASADLYDPKTGTFTRTGSLPASRHFHTATRLLDGRVLIAGGETPSEGMGTATSELYDPKTATFSPTGSMTTPRIFHTATLLHDGRVLMAGGNGDSSAEIYDPVTGTFSSTGSMEIDRDHTATLLRDGRVLVVGDVGAELYDPATGTFSPTGPMLRSRLGSDPIGSPITAPLLSDGRVLVLDASFDVSSNEVVSAELYDPVTGTFSQAGPMNQGRFGFTDTLLSDGRVLFAGDRLPFVCAMVCPSLSPSEAAAINADRSSAELYVP